MRRLPPPPQRPHPRRARAKPHPCPSHLPPRASSALKTEKAALHLARVAVEHGLLDSPGQGVDRLGELRDDLQRSVLAPARDVGHRLAVDGETSASADD